MVSPDSLPENSSDTPSPDSLLRAIVDSSDDSIISKDLSGNVTSWNRSAERIFGYSAEEMLGKPIAILTPPDRIHEEDQFLAKVRMGHRIDHFETTRLRKNGELVDVAASISPVYAASGRIVGSSMLARDLSETKSAKSADLLLAAIVNSSDDAIISKNLDGTITSWNDGAQRLFGYAPEEIIGQSVYKLIPEDRRDEEPRIIQRLTSGERVEHFETVRVRKNGEKFPISLTISPVRNARGNIIGASKIARDISEMKAVAKEREVLLQSERAARAQAENANRMKDDFLSTISHELRTPLNAILGWTEILASSKGDRNDTVLGIAVIKRNATMQARLIEDLLDLGRISSGKMKLNIEPANLKAIIIEAIASVQHAADSKLISIRSELDEVRGVLMGDTKRLQQVVWNILANAIKFTDRGGLVSIQLAHIGPDLALTISDNGRGIAPDFLPFVFERFRQGDASTTRQQGGLGIGLSLVKQIVDLHGGKVRAESRGEGQGAMFVVTLPVSAVKSGHLEDQVHPPVGANVTLADLTGIRVLAVDDDADSVEVVKRILGGRGAEVRIASSVSEAMAILRTFTPDVILSDIGMPNQDGYDFIRQLREHSFFAGIPAVALTALARPEDRTRALDAGFQSHIAKPLAASEIVSVVRSLGRLKGAREKSAGLSR